MGLVRHEWGVLCTATAAFSHCEGRTKFHGLQLNAEEALSL